MTRDLLRKLASVVWLAVVWVLLWGDPAPGTILAGVIVGLGIVYLLPLPRIPVGGTIHPISFIILNLVIAGLLVRATIGVSWLVLKPGPPPRSAFLKRRVDIRSDLVLTLLVDALSLIPGSLVMQVDKVQRVVYVHVLDVRDKKAITKFHRDTDLLEKWFVRAFERRDEWRETTSDEGTDQGRLHQ
ncbi:Na+/H+ antiporter subunit E [Hoyosella sp. G463]|uniref:Na+/H+ antiporter subunit E n=1 Tax=Lolliginicoccus lacisalsi TaxID=2742202 RepID=A0A927PLP9_9ACTN|nr:Na+/H+ antiporter subunit E [Lolliginicoccus lacisalsi]MBD8507380.1 Na+/H+ antiporter subunit E [Lolliginicoccus lacisalsi]